MANFAGTLTEVETGSWRAGGTMIVLKPALMFDTVCRPRMFTNELAGHAWLTGWAERHNAAEIGIDVARLGDAPAA